MRGSLIIMSLSVIAFAGCKTAEQNTIDADKELDYCLTQAAKTVSGLTDSSMIPRSIANAAKNLETEIMINSCRINKRFEYGRKTGRFFFPFIII